MIGFEQENIILICSNVSTNFVLCQPQQVNTWYGKLIVRIQFREEMFQKIRRTGFLETASFVTFKHPRQDLAMHFTLINIRE